MISEAHVFGECSCFGYPETTDARCIALRTAHAKEVEEARSHEECTKRALLMVECEVAESRAAGIAEGKKSHVECEQVAAADYSRGVADGKREMAKETLDYMKGEGQYGFVEVCKWLEAQAAGENRATDCVCGTAVCHSSGPHRLRPTVAEEEKA